MLQEHVAVRELKLRSQEQRKASVNKGHTVPVRLSLHDAHHIPPHGWLVGLVNSVRQNAEDRMQSPHNAEEVLRHSQWVNLCRSVRRDSADRLQPSHNAKTCLASHLTASW